MPQLRVHSVKILCLQSWEYAGCCVLWATLPSQSVSNAQPVYTQEQLSFGSQLVKNSAGTCILNATWIIQWFITQSCDMEFEYFVMAWWRKSSDHPTESWNCLWSKWMTLSIFSHLTPAPLLTSWVSLHPHLPPIFKSYVTMRETAATIPSSVASPATMISSTSSV